MNIQKIAQNRIFQLGVVLIIGVMLGWLIFASGTSDLSHTHEPGEDITYTCSMHPQIRQNEPGKCPICGMDLIPVAQQSGPAALSPYVHTLSPEAIALANISTQIVGAASPDREIQLTGKVAVNEQRLAVIPANYSGRIERLFVDFTGQTISKGQKLATIYSPELVTAQKELIEAAKYKDAHPALYRAAKEKLRLWKIPETQIHEIEQNARVLTEWDVYADRPGVVLRRDVAQGDFVSRGTVLFEIADLGSVWILLDAYESDLPFLRVGQKIAVSVASVPGREIPAAISFIDPLINPQTRTASVRAELNNPQQLLKPEMFVSGIISARLPVKENSLMIPRTALLWTGKRSVVYVKAPDSEFPAFEMREITLGASLGDHYIVENGLSAGEEIVVNGVFAIDAAAQLSGNYSMMNRVADQTIDVPDRFTDQLTDLVRQYLVLTQSLVKSDFHLARTEAKKLGDSLGKMDLRLPDENARAVWIKQHSILKKEIGQLAGAANLEKQREHFAPLSDQLIETVDVFGVRYETLYVAYCPMALDDKGAHWLSDINEIYNPYFGDDMLRCGEIKRPIRSKRAPQVSKPGPPQEHRH